MSVKNAFLLLVAMLMSCFSYAAKNPTDLQRGATCGSHVKKMSDITEWNNPLFEGWYADPQIRLFGDTYWIFPTGKGKGEKASFEAFSSKNLKDWTRHPRILLADDVTWAHNCLWAPDAHEKDGKYYFFFSANNEWYFMYSSGSWVNGTYCVNYSMGDSPFGPFEYKGTVLASQEPIATGPGHHSVINIPGTDDWYICYHRRPIPNKAAAHRVTCLDRLYFEENGDIKPVIMTK